MLMQILIDFLCSICFIWLSIYICFSPNAGKYGPEKTPYLDTIHAVKIDVINLEKFSFFLNYPKMVYELPFLPVTIT